MPMGFSNLPQDLIFMPASSVFGLGDEHQQDQRFLDSQKMMNSNSDCHNLVSSSSSRRFGMNGFHNLSSELERQRLEMDCFLHFQNEKLKTVLHEETRKKEVMMIQNYESKMKAVIHAKDEVLSTASIRTKELQNYLLMAEKEATNWERKAMETEALVTDLNRKLNQARVRRHEDAESVCNGGGDEEKERQMKMWQRSKMVMGMM
ncbi:hypothetical protein L1987_61505 [Smallanthus sonchifolius]|uniref:Uncharacterized protein n=1 Tax=Smallanthus sonchifolius TaxID=185202 RepID=A0ACB9C7X1_9ASTR|nr:hypothetical protein L1987_61505 [Smallanthus sonchifolius]